jgi:hypothetical protein
MRNERRSLTGLFLLTLSIVLGCSQQVDYKSERDKVIRLHDVVMEDQGQIVDNQMKLDTMLKDLRKLKLAFPKLDTLKEKDSLKVVIARLKKSEEQMNTWMHEFEPDVTGKSNEEAVKYFLGEQEKVRKVDSSYKQELKLSNSYLSKFPKK